MGEDVLMLTCHFFPQKLARSLTVKEQLNVPMYYVIKVVIIGCIVGNAPVMSVFIASLKSIETEIVNWNCFQYCRKYLFKGTWWTITPDIVFLFCTALLFILMLMLIILMLILIFQMHYIFLTLCGVKTKLPLTVLNCHTMLIENVCRLLRKSMLPTMVIKLCVKLKYIHQASPVGVEKLTSKVNSAIHHE